MVSGLRKMHVPRAWRVYSATGFDFREKNRAGLGSIGAATLPSASYLATIYYVGKMKQTIFLETWCASVKDNNTSIHGKFHGFLFPFSSKFPELNFAQYVLYISKKRCSYDCIITLASVSRNLTSLILFRCSYNFE